MKITLLISGREMTFSEEELTFILEEYFSDETAMYEYLNKKPYKGPVEGEWFKVDPKSIDRTMFLEERPTKNQEKARKIINEAFAELDRNPLKYDNPFETLIPKKTWELGKIQELEQKSYYLGDHMADWVEQALEWAQRISNGETWKDVCDRPDKSNYWRLIIWKEDKIRIVGGCKNSKDYSSATKIGCDNQQSFNSSSFIVPLVVKRR